MNILIAFSTSDKVYAKILRKIMDCPYHHTFLFVEFKEFGWMALEIDNKGVRFVNVNSIGTYAKKLIYFKPTKDLSNGLILMKNYIGKKYDWKGLFSGAWRLLIKKWFEHEINDGEENPNRMFCSEFVASVLQKSSIPGTSCWIPANISPKMLYDFIKNNEYFIEIT